MNKITKILKDIAEDPGAYLALIALVVIVTAALYILVSAGAGDWRELYCQANPINCIRKGW